MTLIDFMASHVLAFVLSVALLGLIVGSFLNVVVWRLPRMLERDWREQAREVLGLAAEPASLTASPTYNLLLPNSQCPHCAHEIRPDRKSVV